MWKHGPFGPWLAYGCHRMLNLCGVEPPDQSRSMPARSRWFIVLHVRRAALLWPLIAALRCARHCAKKHARSTRTLRWLEMALWRPYIMKAGKEAAVTCGTTLPHTSSIHRRVGWSCGQWATSCSTDCSAALHRGHSPCLPREQE